MTIVQISTFLREVCFAAIALAGRMPGLNALRGVFGCAVGMSFGCAKGRLKHVCVENVLLLAFKPPQMVFSLSYPARPAQGKPAGLS